MKLYPWLLSITIIFTSLQTNADVIVTTGQDNPSGPIVGEVTLRDAINSINSGSGGEIIAFAPNVTTIQLLEPLPAITEQVTIDGLATVMGTEIQPGNCNAIASPVDHPDLFSSSLRVIIDGSQIPTTAADSQNGLLLLSSSIDSVIRGIRIQNITGTDLAPPAKGISAISETLNTSIECCMIDNILCKNSQFILTNSIGLENVTTISKCYITNIKSSPLNYDITPDVTLTAPASGILNTRLVQDTRVECVSSGNIVSQPEKLDPLLQFTVGSANGIANSSASLEEKSKSRGCFVETGSTNEEVTIQNCHISHIKGGSVSLTLIPQLVSLGQVAGIYLIRNLDTLIEDCCICDVQMGSATLSNESNVGSEIGIQLKTEGLFGIFIDDNKKNACIQNNIVHAIAHGEVKINVEKSMTSLSTPIGIFAKTLPLVIEHNSVSSLFGGCHTTAGECSLLRTGSVSTSGLQLETAGIVATQDSGPARHTTKARSVCPTPESGSDPLIILCNNTVTNIFGGTRTAAGEGSAVQSPGSAGIVGSSSENIVANNNTVTTISGANFITKATASTSVLLFGTKGILSSSDKIELCNNTVCSVQEGTVHTTLNSTHLNTEQSESIIILDQTIIVIADAPANTTGIAAINALLSPSARVAIQSNLVKKIIGSQPTETGIAQASVGIGISISPPESLQEEYKNKAYATKQCGSNVRNTISDNTISAITSHITRPAYGIFCTQPSTIENNTIKNVNGGAAALSETISGNGNTIIAGAFCQPGTIPFNELVLIPSILPYEPTSGIYLLDGDCSTVQNNIIQKICAPTSQARGITSTASQDVEVYENALSQIKGPGIFIGGAPIPVGSDIPIELEPISASVRNVMYSNKTFDNTGKGIELGISNWDNLFEGAHLLLGSEGIPTITVVGNHNQPAPKILKIVCNSSGTITITARLNDKNHPNSDFIIQFFVNSTNGIPHGETPITDFDGSEFVMTTDENGTVQKRFVFTPLALITPSDNITAHVTLIRDGSEDIGDTSEFGVEIKPHNILKPLSQKLKPFTFNQLLCK